MRVLELFAGTQSVGKVAREMGFEVVSLDRDMAADIKTDIMDWDYKQHEPKHFDIIWASPPCTEYSRAKTTGVRDIEGANEIVQQTLDILEHFVPKFWMIENPQSGLLKDQICMYGLPFNDVDYCKYGMPYRKRTRIWNNITAWKPRPLCSRDCNSMDSNRKRHIEVAQRIPPGKKETWGDRQTHRQQELYIIPSDLVREIFEAIRQSTEPTYLN
jgi:site-specific DNA-cytosine methylase